MLFPVLTLFTILGYNYDSKKNYFTFSGDLAVKLSEKYEKEGKTSAVDMDIVSF